MNQITWNPYSFAGNSTFSINPAFLAWGTSGKAARTSSRPVRQPQRRQQTDRGEKPAREKTRPAASRTDHMIQQPLIGDRRNFRMPPQHTRTVAGERLLKLAQPRIHASPDSHTFTQTETPAAPIVRCSNRRDEGTAVCRASAAIFR